MFVGLSLLMLLMRYVASIPEDWTDCPSACQCKWISGKKTALCREAGYTMVPNTLNPDMQVLDISGNTIQNLPKDVFRNVGLIHLQRIFLKSAGIYEIHKDAFNELKILVDVDLSDNFISVLHQDTFSGNERLRTLYMNGNPISELGSSQFPNLPHLKTLEFQHCQIKSLHRDTFLHLTALESLHLNDNKLHQLSETVFLPVPKLKTLVLDGNPWKCDCKLRNFRNWLLQSKLYSHPLICTSPAISKGKQWEDVDPTEFACAPNVTSNDSIIQGAPGGNVTLKCNVYGDPEPNVSWVFNSYTLDNDTLIQDSFFYIEEKYTNKKSEKWSIVILYNISDTNAGEYTCKGVNLRGESSVNISLILPKEAVATTMKEDTSWQRLPFFIALILALLLIILIIIFGINRICLKKCRRRNKLKGSVNFSDQDKKLLDVSITTTDRQTGSCEGFGSQPDMEMMEQSAQSIPLEGNPPLHITIESHNTDPSIPVFPPPPEFSSSILPHSTYGNLVISFTIEPATGNRDSTRYPDLIDATRKEKVNVGTTDPIPYFATLPRRGLQHRLKESDVMVSRAAPLMVSRAAPQYDNMGPRITADGSSTISLPETISTEEIPTPPPPPSCSPLTADYISL